jgi:hypothetical protein
MLEYYLKLSLEYSGMYCRVVKLMLTDVSDVRTDSIIALLMEAVRTCETSVNINFDHTAEHPRRLLTSNSPP